MLTFTGTAASVLHPSHVMDYLGRGCCFARLHIQALPLTFQFILGDLINHFFFPVDFDFKTFRQRLFQCCLGVYHSVSHPPVLPLPKAGGRRATISSTTRFLQNKFRADYSRLAKLHTESRAASARPTDRVLFGCA